MLEELMRYINNRFECGCVAGDFEVSGGELEIPTALDGQYVWIEGSTFNDGLYQNGQGGLQDESFTGRVWLLAVPRAAVELADEIAEWCESNSDAIAGPYQSESFGGYSYSMAQGGVSGNETPPAAWQARYGSRLRQWRKLSRDWT